MSDPHEPDHPVTIEGYVTDPKLVGYQVVTNYEITYWQRLVGRDAWMFYLVLRSFCHKGNNTCHPSIRLLMEILGLTDRRQLIGREDTTPGKERTLPGLIDVLQMHDLAAAEIKGEGPKKRYIFHVNLTPSLLRPDQLQELPKALQKKHARLLEQIRQSTQSFDDVRNKKRTIVKKRAAKPPKPADPPADAGDGKGGGTVPPPVVPYQGGGGTVPPKQQPINTTQTTTRARDDRDYNNNSGDDAAPDTDVVVALSDLGLGERVAQRLVRRYRRERVLEKIEFLRYLQETDPDKVKNPRGWVRKAIEDNYGPPDGYQSPAARTAEEAERRRREEERRRQLEREEHRQAQQRATEKAALRRRYGTSDEERQVWAQVLTALEHQAPTPTFTLLRTLRLLKLDETTALLGANNGFEAARVCEHPGTRRLLMEALRAVTGRSLTLDVVLVDEPDIG